METAGSERSEEEESALLGGYRDGVSYGSGFVFVVGLVINWISRLEGVNASDCWWVFSGRVSVLVVFGVFSVISDASPHSYRMSILPPWGEPNRLSPN